VITIAQWYERGAMGAKARAIVQEALAQTRSPGAAPARIQLLNTLANLWGDDRNLLRSIACLEQAAAAAAASQSPAQFTYIYDQLANAYQQLGRKESYAATLEKMRAMAGSDDRQVASIYERTGKMDDAAAMYEKIAEKAQNPIEATAALQSLAALYERRQRYEEARAVLGRAIAAAESSPDASRPMTTNIRMSIARILQQEGKTAAADQVSQEAIDGDPASRFLTLSSYANHLAATRRCAQAETMLKDFMSSNSLSAMEESNILFSLSNVARMSGQNEKAEEYRLAAEELRPVANRPAARPAVLGPYFDRAQAALKDDRPEDAFNLALQGVDEAGAAIDRDSLPYRVTSLAQAFNGRKQAEKAEQLWRRTLDAAESWSAATRQPLLNAM
jgi:tetratricopeptide (TPR) repeat protein